MKLDRPDRGMPIEGPERKPAEQAPRPPDTPGTPGYPSRLESKGLGAKAGVEKSFENGKESGESRQTTGASEFGAGKTDRRTETPRPAGNAGGAEASLTPRLDSRRAYAEYQRQFEKQAHGSSGGGTRTEIADSLTKVPPTGAGQEPERRTEGPEDKTNSGSHDQEPPKPVRVDFSTEPLVVPDRSAPVPDGPREHDGSSASPPDRPNAGNDRPDLHVTIAREPGDQVLRSEDRGHAAHGDAEIREFSPEQLARLKEIEDATRSVADKLGVHVDLTTNPVDPDNAIGIAESIRRLAVEYPSVFREVGLIKTVSPAEMMSTGEDPRRTVGYSSLATETGRGRDRGPGESLEYFDSPPRGLYISQWRMQSKRETDERAQMSFDEGRLVERSATAEGVVLHEFGHHVYDIMMRDSGKLAALSRELGEVGVGMDPVAGTIALIPGRAVIEREIGQYAASSPEESIAETFAQWKLSSDPHPISAAVGRVVDHFFKERHS